MPCLRGKKRRLTGSELHHKFSHKKYSSTADSIRSIAEDVSIINVPWVLNPSKRKRGRVEKCKMEEKQGREEGAT
jgi:hypothetical protein